MWLIVGLGNPGREYAHTRHNAGFLVVDRLAKRAGIRVTKSLRQALVGEGLLSGERVALAKPQTYMNLSGHAVVGLLGWYKLPPGQLIVVYDDKDLPPGRIRVRPDGSHAGHRGMASVMESLGTRQVARVRVGIGRPAEEQKGDERQIGYVLGQFSGPEKALMEEAFERAADAVEAIIAEGVEVAMQRFNGVTK